MGTEQQTVARLIGQLRQSRVDIWCEGGHLHYKSLPGALTTDQLGQLKKYKTAILSFLAEQNSAADRLSQYLNLKGPAHIHLPDGRRAMPMPLRVEELWRRESFSHHVPMNMPFAMRLKGNIDLEQIRQSLTCLMARHDALHSNLCLVDGRPYQIVNAPSQIDLEFFDITGNPETSSMQQFILRPFDLLGGPVFRAGLFRLATGDHVLLLVLHHFFCDGRSMDVLLDEWQRIYRDLAAGTVPVLPDPQSQYYDFALWQRHNLDHDLPGQLGYWLDRLSNLSGASLPYEQPGYGGLTEHINFTIEADIVSSLAEIASATHSTLSNVFHALFHILLARWSGANDIVTGLSVTSRQNVRFAGTIGYLIGAVPVCAHISAEQTFANFLQHLAYTSNEAVLHADIPLELLELVIPPLRNSCRTLFVFNAAPVQTRTRQDENASAVLPITRFSAYALLPQHSPRVSVFRDLCMRLVKPDGRIYATVDYDTELFRQKTIMNLIDAYQELILQVAASPACSLRSLLRRS